MQQHKKPNLMRIYLAKLPGSRDKSNIYFRFFKEAVVKQVFFEMNGLPLHLKQVKLPENLGQKKLCLCPRDFAPHANSRTDAERIKAFEMIVGECLVVQGVGWRKPPLRLEQAWVMEIVCMSC